MFQKSTRSGISRRCDVLHVTACPVEVARHSESRIQQAFEHTPYSERKLYAEPAPACLYCIHRTWDARWLAGRRLACHTETVRAFSGGGAEPTQSNEPIGTAENERLNSFDRVEAAGRLSATGD